MIKYSNKEHTSVLDESGRFIPCDLRNRDFVSLIEAGVVIEPFLPIEVSDNDVLSEYQRRLILLLGCNDLAHAAFVRADDTDELIKLQGSADQTDETKTRISELLERRKGVENLIEKYNNLVPPYPLDYQDDKHWL